jgi:hypothetical protein
MEAKDTKITTDLAGSTVKFLEMLQSEIPKELIISKLKEILESDDKRSSLTAIELISKILGLQIQKSQVLMKSEIYQDIVLGPEQFDEEPIRLTKDNDDEPFKAQPENNKEGENKEEGKE